MSASPRAAALATLLGACHVGTSLGVVAGADGAAKDAPLDAADAPAESPDRPVVPPRDAAKVLRCGRLEPATEDPAERAITGLGSPDPAVAPEPAMPDARFRLYYVADDGALRVESRDAATYARRCVVNLGAPPDRVIAGSPAVASPLNAVVVPARDAEGCLSLWTREDPSGARGDCAGAYGPWAQLPQPEQGIASAPGSIGQDAPLNLIVVTAASPDGELLVFKRRVGAPVQFGTWTVAPDRPVGVRVLGRPGVLDWGVELHFFALTESSRGNRSFYRVVNVASTGDVWLANWVQQPSAVDDPPRSGASALSQSLVGTAAMWVSYASEQGRVLTQKLYDSEGIQTWSEWRALEVPWAGEVVVPSAASFGFARRGPLARSEAIMVAIPRGQRALYVAPWDPASQWFESWVRAPDDPE